MRRLIIFLIAVFVSCSLFAEGDIITLLDQRTFSGSVVGIKDCSVIFRVDHERFKIPAADIFSVQFADVTHKVYQDYLQLEDPDKCLVAKSEAKMHHGKTGKHVLLGVLFGPFAIIGAAAASPMPQKDAGTLLNGTSALFDDPVYLKCYKEKAKAMNMGNALLGWILWIGTITLINVASAG